MYYKYMRVLQELNIFYVLSLYDMVMPLGVRAWEIFSYHQFR